MKYSTIILLILSFMFTACMSPQKVSKEDVEKILMDNPKIITNWIEKNPDLYVETTQKVFKQYSESKKMNKAEAERKAFEDQIKNPLNFEMNEVRALGSKDAKIKIIEYSDFECPFCSRGYSVVQDLKRKYGENLVFEYRHLPLPMHPTALPGAQVFEAILMQDKEKAYKFHDQVFERQSELRTKKEALYLDIAQKLDVDMEKMKEDMNSKEVEEIIKGHMDEARTYGISGTPGFLVNGVLIKGAYPLPFFTNIISSTTDLK